MFKPDFFPQDRLLLEVGKVSGEFLGATVGEGDRPGAEGVKQSAVVGNKQDCPRIVDEVLLHPDLRFDIEVVRRLVEQQDFGLLKKKFRHGDPHLPTAGEFRAVAFEVLVLEAEALEDRFDLGLHQLRIVVVKLELELADLLQQIAIGGGTGVELDEFVGESLHLFAQRDGLSESGFRFLP